MKTLFLTILPGWVSALAMNDPAAAYNQYASAAVELSDSHVAENGLWTGKLYDMGRK